MASIYQANKMAMIRCEACGGLHMVNVCSKAVFNRAYCPVEQAPIFSKPKTYIKVFKEIERALAA